MLVYKEIGGVSVARVDETSLGTPGALGQSKRATTDAVVWPPGCVPALSMSAHKRQSIGTAMAGRKGVQAGFRVAPLADCTIYQVVEFRYTIDGVTAPPVIYTEAWSVKRKGRKAAIEQNGTDSCLVSNQDVRQSAGELRLVTMAWLEPGNVDSSLGVDGGRQLWGTLRGAMGARPVPESSRVLEREILISWPKGGPDEVSIDGEKLGLLPSTKGSKCVLPDLILGDFGAGTGSNMQIGAKACSDRGIVVKVGMTAEPIESLLYAPKRRDDPWYRTACFVRYIEELDPNSASFRALHIINASLPCAAYRVNLSNEFLGWCVADSRVMSMFVMGSLAACGQKALVKMENTRAFTSSPACIFVRDMVSAAGGGSMVWTGVGADQELPVNGIRTHLFLANSESKHLLEGIEEDLRSGARVKRVLLSDILGREGHTQRVSEELVFVPDKVAHGGSADGPTRLGTLMTKNNVYVAPVFRSSEATDVARRPRRAPSALGVMGAYRVGNVCVEFTRIGVCAVTGSDPVLVALLSDEDAFRALGGVANYGVEVRVWEAIASSLVRFTPQWVKAFAVKALMPNHDLAQVVERHVTSFCGSPFLDVLPLEGRRIMEPFVGFSKMPKLNVVAIGQSPPLALMQACQRFNLTTLVGWVPLLCAGDGAFSTSYTGKADALGLGIAQPAKAMLGLLESASGVCGIEVPKIWTADALKLDGPPADVMVWQSRSPSEVHLPLLRELLLKARCAIMRIKVLCSDGLEALLAWLRTICRSARYRVRSEDNDSATHGDAFSSADGQLITLLYLPLFCVREGESANVGTPERGTTFRVARGDTHCSITDIATSIGLILAGLPDGSVVGSFKQAGLRKGVASCVLERYHPRMEVAEDASRMLSMTGTIPHDSELAKIALHDTRAVLRNGHSLVRRPLTAEVLSALGLASALCKVIREAGLEVEANARDLQQLVWETAPFHSLTAQILMMYSFILPMLSTHARRIVMGQMQFDELDKITSTRGARCAVGTKVTTVPTVGSLPASILVPFVTKHELMVEVDGHMLTIPAGILVKKCVQRSCRPRQLLEQMEVQSEMEATRAGAVVHTGNVGAKFFRWQ